MNIHIAVGPAYCDCVLVEVDEEGPLGGLAAIGGAVEHQVAIALRGMAGGVHSVMIQCNSIMQLMEFMLYYPTPLTTYFSVWILRVVNYG